MAGAGEQLAGFPELLFGKARGSSRHSTGMGHSPQAEPSRAEPHTPQWQPPAAVWPHSATWTAREDGPPHPATPQGPRTALPNP